MKNKYLIGVSCCFKIIQRKRKLDKNEKIGLKSWKSLEKLSGGAYP